MSVTEIEQLLLSPPFEVISSLCSVIDDLTSDDGQGFSPSDLCTTILTLFQAKNKQHDLFMELIKTEVNNTNGESTLFRHNSITTKLLTNYSLQVGIEYFRYILSPILRCIPTLTLDNYEMDPTRINNPTDEKIIENTENVIQFCELILNRLEETIDEFPLGLKKACRDLHVLVKAKFPNSQYSCVGGLIFLRLICPIIITPEEFGILPRGSVGKNRRILILVSKFLQNISNNVISSSSSCTGEKMNEYISSKAPIIVQYFAKLSVNDINSDDIEKSTPSDTTIKKTVERIAQYLKGHIHKVGIYLVSGRFISKKVAMNQLSEKKGYLYKYGENILTESWRKRYFVLGTERLLYFKTIEDSHAAGTIQLSDYEVSNINYNEFTFQLEGPQRTYHLKGSNKNDIVSWIEKIQVVTKSYQKPRTASRISNISTPKKKNKSSIRASRYVFNTVRSKKTKSEFYSGPRTIDDIEFDRKKQAPIRSSSQNYFAKQAKRSTNVPINKKLFLGTYRTKPEVQKPKIIDEPQLRQKWTYKPSRTRKTRSIAASRESIIRNRDNNKETNKDIRSTTVLNEVVRDTLKKDNLSQYEGKLEVWNENSTKWVMSWAVIEKSSLVIYSSKEEKITPISKILLIGVEIFVKQPNFTIIRGNYDFTFRARIKNSCSEWVEQIKLKRNSPTSILSELLDYKKVNDTEWKCVWVELGSKLLSTFKRDKHINIPSEFLDVTNSTVYKPDSNSLIIGVEDRTTSLLFKFKEERLLQKWMSAIKVTKVSFWQNQDSKDNFIVKARDRAISVGVGNEFSHTPPEQLFMDAIETGFLLVYFSKEQKLTSRYWFVLRGTTLLFYKSEYCCDLVNKVDIQLSMMRINDTPDSFSFELLGRENVLYLEAADGVDLRTWQRAFHFARLNQQKTTNENELVSHRGVLLSYGKIDINYIFVLNGSKLSWYSETDENLESCVSSIGIENCIFCNFVDSNFEGNDQCGFQISNNQKELYLVANSIEDKNMWLKKLKIAKLQFWNCPTISDNFNNRGYLWKVGKKLQRRWIVLNDIYLLIYKSPRDHSPEVEIDLNNAQVLPIECKETNLRIEIRYDKTSLSLDCSNSACKKRWIDAIKDARASQRKKQPIEKSELSNERYLALRTPDHEGFLMKQGVKIKNWKKRWFVLQYPCLFYFSSSQISPGMHSGVIPLKDAKVVVKKQNDEFDEATQFQIETRFRIFFLRADTEDTLNEWVDVIERLHHASKDDNSITIANPSNNLKGYLVKRGRNNKLWKKRYFSLSGTILSYYNSEKEENPMGVIPLEGCTVDIAEESIKRKYSFVISTRYRNYFLEAEDQFEMAKWIESIRFHSQDSSQNNAEYKNVDIFNKLNSLLAQHEKNKL